jgi:hypothetical protein
MIKVSISVQQQMPVAKAKSRNQAVNRLADSSAPLSERPEVSGGRDSQFLTTRLKNFELAKIMQNPREHPLTSDTLKNLVKNQIRQSEALPPKLAIQVIGLAILQPMQIVDPHRSINDHHRPRLRESPKAGALSQPSRVPYGAAGPDSGYIKEGEKDGSGDADAGGADRLFSPPSCSRCCIAFSNTFW